MQQAVQAVAGGGVTISINIPSLGTAQEKNVTIDQPAEKANTLVIQTNNTDMLLPEDYEA